MSLQRIDRVQPQLHTTGRVRPHVDTGGLPHTRVLRIEPDRVTIRGRTHEPVIALHQRHRHTPTLSATPGRAGTLRRESLYLLDLLEASRRPPPRRSGDRGR